MKRLLIASALLLAHAAASADIFQWEYIDPADPEQGKQQSTVLCPDGAGAIAYLFASLDNRDLTRAYLPNAHLFKATFANSNLSEAYLAHAILDSSNLSHANLTQADLSFANLWDVNLTGANLSGARIRGASLFTTTLQPVISNAQLFSTASYQEGDLRQISFYWNDFDDVDFAGMDLSQGGFSFTSMIKANLQSANLHSVHFGNSNLTEADLSYADLSNADFYQSNLTGANFNGANIRAASFVNGPEHNVLTVSQLQSTESYLSRDLSGANFVAIDLVGSNFANFNLTGTAFDSTDVTGVDFTGADVLAARFVSSHVTPEQLTSTASYQARNLRAVTLQDEHLPGIDLSYQNLYGAVLSSDFTGANFTGANLQNARAHGANFNDVNFNAADFRGWNEVFETTFSGAITYNAIHAYGEIFGLALGDLFPTWLPREMVVHDYVPLLTPIPIFVSQQFRVMPGGTLRLVFDDDGWSSGISLVTSDIELGGTLELTFEPDVDVASQVGNIFFLFNWDELLSESAGTFNVVSPYRWDLSNLYTTGEVRLLGVPEPAVGSLAILCVGALLMRLSLRHPNWMPRSTSDTMDIVRRGG